MIHLALQTEFTFKQSFLHMKDVHKFSNGAVGIADLHNTFGHVGLEKESKKHGFKPIYGVRLFCLPDESKQRNAALPWIFIAKNAEGLKEIYQYVDLAWKNFYYIPRLNFSNIKRTGNVIIISPIDSELSDYVAIGQGWPNISGEQTRVAIVTNNYPTLQDVDVYQLLAGARKGNGDSVNHMFNQEIYPQHIVSEREWLAEYNEPDSIKNTHEINEQIEHIKLPKAGMVHWTGDHDLKKFMDFKKVENWDDVYQARFDREMDLIKQKDYTDYFLIVADMIKHSKKTMLIGPARGSSAGSLVCYLMGITEVDPIKYDLIFERFIDINRHDLPDIDVDFPDHKRENVVNYLKHKYGHKKVRALANVNRLKAKSAIGEFAKALEIPAYETAEVKDAIIERSSGDARAAMCIADTFETTEAGQKFIERYPAMSLVSHIEGHASHAGKHAAGILVSTEELATYGSINERDDIIQMDKKDAEYLGLLKIDCLGLRTLSILEEVAEQLGKPYKWFYTIPTDDQATFTMMKNLRLNGVFQFEGQALQIIVKQMGVNNFDDIVAITALARPGALNSGGTARYIKYSTGQETPTYYSDVHRSITGDTYGIVVYQEQMMNIARLIGGLSWEDTSDLRRAASKSMGDEFFARYKDKFIIGALEYGCSAADSEQLWVDISASGSWSFNKCLSGNTKVIMASPGNNMPREMTIRELYDSYVMNPKSYVKTRMNKGIGPQLISLYPDGRCRPQYASNIVFNGKRRVNSYSFSNFETIDCTPDHKFIVNGKWMPIGEAKIGDKILIGEYEKTKHESTKHLTGSGNINNGIDNKGQSNPAYINGKTKHLHEQQDIAREAGCRCEDCNMTHDRLEVHHNDFNEGYDRSTDTSILCPSCHKKRHYEAGRVKRWGKGYATSEVILMEIDEGEFEDTYDIVMPEHHNFLINGGIITHNSHAVSYGLVSYWTAYCKANYPAEFAVACLNHATDSDSAIKLLRDFVINEGFDYKPVDPDKSGMGWTADGKTLIGGLTNIKGIGPAKAKQIINARNGKGKLTPSLFKALMQPETELDILFPAEHYFGFLYSDPVSAGLDTRPHFIKDVNGKGEYVIIGKLVDRNLRDLNEQVFLEKRGGERITENCFYLNFKIEDDTDMISCKIGRLQYEAFGKDIAEKGRIGKDWYLLRGTIDGDWRTINVKEIVNLNAYYKVEPN